MTDTNSRIKIIEATGATLAAASAEGTPGIQSDSGYSGWGAYAWTWYGGGAWRWAAPGDASGNLKAAAIYTGGTLRIGLAGAGAFTMLSVSGLTNGKIPRISSGSGQFTDSCFGDDGTNATCTRPLTLNGATRPAWGGAFANALQLTPEVATAQYASIGPQAHQVWANVYFDGINYRAVSGYAGQGFPVIFITFNGGISLRSSISNPVAGGIISDMSEKWSVDRFGKMVATAISISTPVTREAIIQPLPITNSAPGVVTVGPSGGVKSFGFDGGASTEELFYHLDVQHDYVSGTDMIFHVHWTPSTATEGDVKWQIEYQWVEAGGTWPAPTAASSTVAAGTVAWADKRADFTISGTGHTYNSRILFRLFRNPADVADTYAGDAVLTSVGLHYSANIGQP